MFSLVSLKPSTKDPTSSRNYLKRRRLSMKHTSTSLSVQITQRGENNEEREKLKLKKKKLEVQTKKKKKKNSEVQAEELRGFLIVRVSYSCLQINGGFDSLGFYCKFDIHRLIETPYSISRERKFEGESGIMQTGVVVEGGQRALNGGGVVDDGATKKFVQPKQHKQSLHQIGTVQQLLAGGIAGALSKTCTAPLGRLTILFQLQGMHSDVATLRKASIWHEASRIVGEEGFRAFWKGNLVTIAHRLPYSSVNFYAYEQYKKLLQMIPGLGRRGENISADLCVHFIGGGLAGITAASVTYPLDLVRTRLAAQTNVIYYRGIWHAIRTITREEGMLGLYKGLGATLLSVGPSIAVSFSVYESLRSSWQSRRPHDSTVVISLGCGSLSGIASSTATFPLDLLRRRMQLEGAGGRARVYTTGLLGTFRHITRTEGLRGLYRGILPEYYKVVPGVGICFMTYETLKMLFLDLSAASD